MAFDSCTSSWTGIKGAGDFKFSCLDGLKFCNYELDEVVPWVPWDQDPWDQVVDGLNFAGVCLNNVCPAYNEEVSPCVVGDTRDTFGSFDVAKDTCFCKCPICQTPILTDITCFLSSCKWSYDGVMVLSPETEGASTTGTLRHQFGNGVAASADGYYEFKGGLVNWRYLRFEISPLDDMDVNPIHDDAADVNGGNDLEVRYEDVNPIRDDAADVNGGNDSEVQNDPDGKKNNQDDDQTEELDFGIMTIF